MHPPGLLSEGGKKGKTNPHLKTMEESSTQFMIKVQKNLPYNSWYTVFRQTQVLFQREWESTSPKPNGSVHSSGPQPRGTWKYTHTHTHPTSERFREVLGSQNGEKSPNQHTDETRLWGTWNGRYSRSSAGWSPFWRFLRLTYKV